MKKFFLKVLTTILMTMISWSTMAQIPGKKIVKPKCYGVKSEKY